MRGAVGANGCAFVCNDITNLICFAAIIAAVHLALKNAFVIHTFGVAKTVWFADFRQIDASVSDAFLIRVALIVTVRFGAWRVGFALAVDALFGCGTLVVASIRGWL